MGLFDGIERVGNRLFGSLEKIVSVPGDVATSSSKHLDKALDAATDGLGGIGGLLGNSSVFLMGGLGLVALLILRSDKVGAAIGAARR